MAQFNLWRDQQMIVPTATVSLQVRFSARLEGDRVVREIELELGMARPDVVKRLGPLQTVLQA
jgi:hypothetical protein